MRHFEKQGSLRIFRRIKALGSKVHIAIGSASDGELEIAIPCGTAAKAIRVADDWARWALEAGYAEVIRPEGDPGVVRSLKSPTGPGRVRTDASEDVYFETSPVKLAIGKRAIVQGVHQVARLKVDFMFGSRMVAERLVPFPNPKWSRFRAKPDLTAKTRRALAALAGPALMGHEKQSRPFGNVAAGTLIFAYERGIHRFLRKSGSMVIYENVLTSTLKRQTSPPLMCHPMFCSRLPKKLEQRLGL